MGSLGIVGAIASGKSTAARWFEARGWAVVDADTEAHALYAPGSELVAALEARFGSGIVRRDGAVDRAALGEIVFADPKALADLDALVHPLARHRIRRAVDSARSTGADVVLEMALLHRWPEMVSSLDRVLGIRCSDPIRLERLAGQRGMTLEQARLRLSAQDQDLLLSVADVSVPNDGTRRELEERLDEFQLGQKAS
ncbi:MAG TPA: dephospho-CoA kinase [Fibrobacteria bacterium]|nr:dephospho-CoA kinase [Fibrobacteria bacterium]